jgi:hypothetical protein
MVRKNEIKKGRYGRKRRYGDRQNETNELCL